MSAGGAGEDAFAPVLACLTRPWRILLEAQLSRVPGIEPDEQAIIRDGALAALTDCLHRKVCRLLVLEVNAARVTGRLQAADSVGRWHEWVDGASRRAFWESLRPRYPGLLPRLELIGSNRCAAALTMAARFARDRGELARLPGAGGGDLTRVVFGAGDSHHGGHTVALLRTTGGRVVYKPRPVLVDARLAGLLMVVAEGEAPPRIRVPEVLVRDGYGWAEHVEHRYCADDGELAMFYERVGHWLAVMRLLGGSDLHAENVIAVGPVPVVVDCETLFTPYIPGPSLGCGHAMDRAAELLEDSVLRVGLLPTRGAVLGFRGVDNSAVGGLPGEQPAISAPVIAGAGTDEVRIEYAPLPVTSAQNLPDPSPVLSRHWDKVLAGFTQMSGRLRQFDRTGQLPRLLADFADCPVRVVTRATETYLELARMLWHPASLHDEPTARDRAARLLARHAANSPLASADPDVIDAEIGDLIHGDIPAFTTTPRSGRLTGPSGQTRGPVRDLTQHALSRWRVGDLALDRQMIQGSLVSAYLNEGWLPGQERPVRVPKIASGNLDQRRRRLAAELMRAVLRAAIRGSDGSVAWIAPTVTPTGWGMQLLSRDMYSGLPGIGVLCAAYLLEAACGRADPVVGLEPLLGNLLTTWQAMEDQDTQARLEAAIRPDPPGGYVGIGSQIWAWLLLSRLPVPCLNPADAITRAQMAAASMPIALTAATSLDLLQGSAGAIVPLLRLAEYTDQPRWSALAAEAGLTIATRAEIHDGLACWPSSQFPRGIGGVSHGATGISWALARLSAAGTYPLSPAIGDTTSAAFAFEDANYDPERKGWTDVRDHTDMAAAWCHGGGGIGIVAADLAGCAPDRWHPILRQAAASSWSHGFGWNHTLCHGDLGLWEVLDHALATECAPPGLDRRTLDAHIITSLEVHGPVTGLARHAFTPGLMPGVSGIAYQLLRMNPDSPLPSVLLPDPGAPISLPEAKGSACGTLR